MFNKGTVLLPMQFFHVKPTLRWILAMPKFQMLLFLSQSLLLITTVLNDDIYTVAELNFKSMLCICHSYVQVTHY